MSERVNDVPALCVPDEIQAIRSELFLKRAASPETLHRIDGLLRRFPDSPQLWLLRGRAMQLCDAGELRRGDAIESYQRALALDPSNHEASEELNRLLQLS
jgi:predicted Zn-dependent protease